jgi:hypothetical protein
MINHLKSVAWEGELGLAQGKNKGPGSRCRDLFHGQN